ncbi:MAG: FlgD immunoglobulin-like domain containing protein [Candidatus Neomarinimicrobiota bacterium]
MKINMINGLNHKIALKISIALTLIAYLSAQEYRMITQQVSLSQKPMISDSLTLNGSLGKNFSQISSGDTLTLSGGVWNIASGIYSLPPTIKTIFPDTVRRFQKDIFVEAIINDINGVEKAELHAQFGGQTKPIVLPMQSIDDSTFVVRIDDSLKTIYNLRAQVVTVDGMSNVGRSSQSSPTMQFGRGELSMSDSVYSYYPDGLPSEKWSLISVPGLLDSNMVEKSELNEGHVFYDWDPNLAEEGDWFKPDSIVIGKAYWFKHKYSEPVIFSNKDTSGYSVPLEDYQIDLRKGPNLIGSPFPFPVQAKFSEGVSSPYKYSPDLKDGWADTNVFEPWAGYAIQSLTDSGKITFIPFEDSSTLGRTVQNGWILDLNLSGEISFDRSSSIGRQKNSKESIDINDMPILPSPSDRIFISIDLNNNGFFNHSTDYRSSSEINGVWNIRVNKGRDRGTILFNGSYREDLPRDIILAIIDIGNRTVIRDFPDNELTIQDNNNSVYDLKFIIGEEGYVLSTIDEILSTIPTEFTLGQNYPNPFNPTTNIDIAIPHTGEVTLVIYNILGQQIRTLLAKNMEYGFHTTTWNGLDQSGRAVSSGVYFSELRARGFRQTKKMLLLK